jgi:hypothetical protein
LCKAVAVSAETSAMAALLNLMAPAGLSGAVMIESYIISPPIEKTGITMIAPGLAMLVFIATVSGSGLAMLDDIITTSSITTPDSFVSHANQGMLSLGSTSHVSKTCASPAPDSITEMVRFPAQHFLIS